MPTHESLSIYSVSRYKGCEIDMNEALNILSEMLSESNVNDILCYRGSENFALMQEISEHFFAHR